MTDNWFEGLFGFRERTYDETRNNLDVVGSTLRSKVNQRSYAVGTLTTPSLRELRAEAATVLDGLRGRLRVSNIAGDVRSMHSSAAHHGALFQVASQFNLLEMTGPEVTPEDGVTRYAHDRTQGPACALAAGAATVYRNYFAPVAGRIGAALGNEMNAFWTMRNGYALCTRPGLTTIAQKLKGPDVSAADQLRDLLRVGIHRGVQVTDVAGAQLVSQAFCSALPVSYSDISSKYWKSFATLVLEGAYEATVWAAVLNAHDSGTNMVFLTRLGGGAFGNEPEWIHAAMRRALKKVLGVGLDVRIVSYRNADCALERLVAEFE